jgi:hypothetical protein
MGSGGFTGADGGVLEMLEILMIDFLEARSAPDCDGAQANAL